jgi:HK97 family phage major capsid protein
MRMTELELEQLIQKRVLEELKKPIGGKIPYNGDYDLDRTKTGSFRNITEFLKAVKVNDREALRQCIPDEAEFKDLEVGSGSGQFTIPGAFRAELLDLLEHTAIAMPRSTQYRIGKNQGVSLTVPGVDMTSFSENGWGGIKIYPTAESASYTESDAVLRQIRLQLKKITGLCDLSEELLFGSGVDMGKTISQLLAQAMSYYLDRWMINTGNGVSYPLSILNGGDLIEVSAESGQTEGVVYENVVAMLEAMNPNAYQQKSDSLCWLAHPSLVADLLLMNQKVGVGGSNIPILDYSTYNWKLLGLPLFITQAVPTAKSAGAFMLCNFKAYSVLSRGDMLIRSTTTDASKWAQDIVSYKITYYVDSQPTNAGTITLADGTTTVANFVKLGAVT